MPGPSHAARCAAPRRPEPRRPESEGPGRHRRSPRMFAPVRRRWRGARNSSIGPTAVISSPAPSSPLPTRRLPAGTPARPSGPTEARPRPSSPGGPDGPAPSSACRPPAPRSPSGSDATLSSSRVCTAPAAKAGASSAAIRYPRLVSTPATRVRASASSSRWRAASRRVAARDDLGQQRVIKGRDLAAAIDRALHPHVGRERHLGQQAGAGLEPARRILGVEARLDRGPARQRAPAPAAAVRRAATRTIHSTRSTPVTCSVTPCST